MLMKSVGWKGYRYLFKYLPHSSIIKSHTSFSGGSLFLFQIGLLCTTHRCFSWTWSILRAQLAPYLLPTIVTSKQTKISQFGKLHMIWDTLKLWKRQKYRFLAFVKYFIMILNLITLWNFQRNLGVSANIIFGHG